MTGGIIRKCSHDGDMVLSLFFFLLSIFLPFQFFFLYLFDVLHGVPFFIIFFLNYNGKWKLDYLLLSLAPY